MVGLPTKIFIIATNPLPQQLVSFTAYTINTINKYAIQVVFFEYFYPYVCLTIATMLLLVAAKTNNIYKIIQLQLRMESSKTISKNGNTQTAGGRISLELIEEQLLNIIRYDPAETVDHEGKVLPLNEIPEHARAGILSYEPSASGTKVRGYNKLTAITLALKLRDCQAKKKTQGETAEIADEDEIDRADNEGNMLSAGEQILMDQVEERLLNIICYDSAQTVDHEGNLLPLNKIPHSTRSAIHAYEPSTSGTKVSGYSKLTAITLAMKLNGWEPPGKSGEITRLEGEIDWAAFNKDLEWIEMISQQLEEEH